MKPTTRELSDQGRIWGDTEVLLAGRRHATYCGPVHAWCGLFWIFYDDSPVHVLCFPDEKWIEERAAIGRQVSWNNPISGKREGKLLGLANGQLNWRGDPYVRVETAAGDVNVCLSALELM